MRRPSRPIDTRFGGIDRGDEQIFESLPFLYQMTQMKTFGPKPIHDRIDRLAIAQTDFPIVAALRHGVALSLQFADGEDLAISQSDDEQAFLPSQ